MDQKSFNRKSALKAVTKTAEISKNGSKVFQMDFLPKDAKLEQQNPHKSLGKKYDDNDSVSIASSIAPSVFDMSNSF